jgi:hypothetical protein
VSADNNNSSQNLRVFISYARQDSEAANRLYDDLKISGLEPWLDTESLLGGENWRIAIKEAISNSRYFIPLLSSNSLEKIGYVQRELKEALEIRLEFPQSKRFIIPARLDESEVNDEKLRELHMVDLFPDWDEGVQRILKSMELNKSKSNQERSFCQFDPFDEWKELLRYVYEKKCTPLIGPDAHIRWIPSNRNIAIKWAEEHAYPFNDSYELPQVAQFMAVTRDDDIYPKKYLSMILKSMHRPNFKAPEYKNTVYAVLADLNLPIYVTTNYDHLMEEALISNGKEPKSEFCRWNKSVIEFSKRAEIPFLSDDRTYVPSSANPLVFHLHGDMDYPLTMVLTEQDYLDFIFNMSTLDRNPIMISPIIRKSFATSSQLFIGFTLNDANSRILFRSVAGFLSIVEPPYTIAVMPSPYTNRNGENVTKTKNYLNDYARNIFRLKIHWSDPFLFSIQLRDSFNKFRVSSK